MGGPFRSSVRLIPHKSQTLIFFFGREIAERAKELSPRLPTRVVNHWTALLLVMLFALILKRQVTVQKTDAICEVS